MGLTRNGSTAACIVTQLRVVPVPHGAHNIERDRETQNKPPHPQGERRSVNNTMAHGTSSPTVNEPQNAAFMPSKPADPTQVRSPSVYTYAYISANLYP